MFYGSLGGDFRAVDRNSGKVLWSRKLGSGIVGNPITYKVDGKQYVSVYAGIGGWVGLPVAAGLDLNDKFGAIGATAIAKATGLNLIPQGGTLYTFSLAARLALAKRLQLRRFLAAGAFASQLGIGTRDFANKGIDHDIWRTGGSHLR